MSRFDRFWMSQGGMILGMIVIIALVWFGWSDIVAWAGA